MSAATEETMENENEITAQENAKSSPTPAEAEEAEVAEDNQTLSLELYKDLDVDVDPKVIEKLKSGFLQKFLPALEKSRSSLEEVLSNQRILIETVEQENAKFNECKETQELTQTMMKAKRYYNKLMVIKKDMANIHEKSAKLKKRAVKLQQQRQKSELQRAQQRERELEKERLLAARVAKNADS